MKKYLFLFMLFAALFATAQTDTVSFNPPNDSSGYVIEQADGSVSISDVLATSEAENFIDSMRAVAAALSDPEFKSLIMQGVNYWENKPKEGSESETWYYWIYGLVVVASTAIGYLIRHVKGKFSKTVIPLLAFGLMFMSSCASCTFTSDYQTNKDDGTVTGCVSCKNANKYADKLKTKINPYFKIIN